MTLTMAATNRDSVLTVTDLLDRPGASRRVELDLAVPEGLPLTLVEVPEALRFTGVIESVVDGLLVRGSLGATMRLSCARCLAGVERDVHTDIVELFAVPGGAGAGEDIEAGYEIDEGTIDLDTLLRDALVPAAPYQPLCKPECLGLCATCGTNRNDAACNCEEERRDSRWAPLEGLRLPPDA